MKTFTLAFTQKSARQFFGLIRGNNIARIVDVRLNNISQLSGFAKRDDLKYFLRELCDADYVQVKDLAPTRDILEAYKKKDISWDAYSDQFLNLIAQRNIERTIDKALLEDGCLLCSEHKPHFCHRRLVVEYLNSHWGGGIQIVHLL